MECSAIFEDYLSNCISPIEVNGNFPPGVLLKWVLTAPNGNEYFGEGIPDANGMLSIPLADIPAGLLTQYGGTFFLQFFDTPYQCRKVNFVIGKEVDAIAFTIKAGNNQKPNLGCPV